MDKEALSGITTWMKYARYEPDLERRETWDELVNRRKQMDLAKFKDKPEVLAQIEHVFENFVRPKRILPSMRSMQFAGKAVELNNARIFNCSYLPITDVKAFSETMFLLLTGCGVGYSVQRHHVEQLPTIKHQTKTRRYVIADSIAGWADAVKVLLRAYLDPAKTTRPIFDYSDIRPKGARLVTSGGKAPGPEPLREALNKIEAILRSKEQHTKLTPLECHDIQCHIADAVLSGGVRRAAMLSLFSHGDSDMMACKSGSWWELNPQRGRANNSVMLLKNRVTQVDFFEVFDYLKNSGSGEPGFYFSADKNMGTNPCCEIALEAYGFCNLVEIDASKISSQEDLNECVDAASFLGTLQASYTDFYYLRDEWKNRAQKDALLGVSFTGIASGRLDHLDVTAAAKLVNEVNVKVASQIGVNPAKRTTCVKPSGTTSLVLGTSSGIHAWHAPYYIRRIRINKAEALYTYLSIHHPYLLEDEYFDPEKTAVMSFPQASPYGSVCREDESAVELLERSHGFYNDWVVPGHVKGDNTHNVSLTVSVKDHEWLDVRDWIWTHHQDVTGIACLPFSNANYPQMPFQDISENTYLNLVNQMVGTVDLSQVIEFDDNTLLNDQAACAGGACEIT